MRKIWNGVYATSRHVGVHVYPKVFYKSSINCNYNQDTIKLYLQMNHYKSVVSSSRDLMSWINGIRGLVSSDELAKDVTGAEALLERHQVLNAMKKHPSTQCRSMFSCCGLL